MFINVLYKIKTIIFDRLAFVCDIKAEKKVHRHFQGSIKYHDFLVKIVFTLIFNLLP